MAPDMDFREKLAAARSAQERAKELKDGEYPPDPPAGEYIGKLAAARPNISSKGNPYILRTVVISEGESEGMIARDVITLTQDFLIARARDFVQGHEGYGWPAEIFNIPESERQDTWIFHEDLVDTLKAIEADGPVYRFGFTPGEGNPGRIKILEVIGAAPAAAPTAPPPAAKGPPPAASIGPTLAARLVLFCAAQGFEGVKQDDDAETIVEVLKKYSLWSKKVTQEQLTEAGYQDWKPEQGIGPEDIALLEEAGLSEIVMVPVKRRGPPQKKKK